MSKFFLFQITSTLLVGFILSSCRAKKENFDIDLSNLKLPKKSNVINSTKDISIPSETKNKTIISELINYQDKSEILRSIKLGKIDPFSKKGIKDKLNTLIKVKGFLNTKNNNYVFVSYLGEKGTVSEESIGGVNTTLLPNGAKVVSIDPKNLELIINFENKNYILKL